jgi:hypothetical protein
MRTKKIATGIANWVTGSGRGIATHFLRNLIRLMDGPNNEPLATGMTFIAGDELPRCQRHWKNLLGWFSNQRGMFQMRHRISPEALGSEFDTEQISLSFLSVCRPAWTAHGGKLVLRDGDMARKRFEVGQASETEDL